MIMDLFQQCSADVKTLWAWITFNGGLVQSKLNAKVTHLLTTLPAGVCSVCKSVNEASYGFSKSNMKWHYLKILI